MVNHLWFIDFDNTVYNTRGLLSYWFSKLQNGLDINYEEFLQIYQSSKEDGNFNPSRFQALLCMYNYSSNLAEINRICSSFPQELILPGAQKFLRGITKTQTHEGYFLTQGNPAYQKHKIQSVFGKPPLEIIAVPNKIAHLESIFPHIWQSYPYTKIHIIDDRADVIRKAVGLAQENNLRFKAHLVAQANRHNPEGFFDEVRQQYFNINQGIERQ